MSSLLSWEQPKRLKSTEEWQERSADGAPPGVYVPNMSKDDQLKWKAKLIGKNSETPRIEIRKTGRLTFTQMLVIVSLGNGYRYKHYKPENTLGTNVHISLNGPMRLTFEEMNEFSQAINEAKTFLESVKISTTQ